VEIIQKLNHEQLSDLILASDQQSLRHELAQLPAQAREAAERSEEFWAAQRAAVWSRISGHERVRRWMPSLAAAAAAAIIAIAILLAPHKTKPQLVSAPQVISDQELLVQVERIVQSETPASLQPAGLLAPELAEYKPTVQKKESHEN
jgi:hypothetical protein